jgi:hypothetical protein
MSSRAVDLARPEAPLVGVIDVDDHHDARLRREPDERDDADPDGRRQIVSKKPEGPSAPDEREGHREEHDEHLGEVLELQIEEHHDVTRSAMGMSTFMRSSMSARSSYCPVHLR